MEQVVNRLVNQAPVRVGEERAGSKVQPQARLTGKSCSGRKMN